MSRRGDALTEARRWIGTPYHHRASKRGVGCDCLGLVRGIWRRLYGREAWRLPEYGPGWVGDSDGDRLLEACRDHAIEIALHAARPGDLLLFRPHRSGPVKHCAVLSDRDFIIHAYWGRSVCETALSPWWRNRRVAAFALPETGDA